MQRLCMSNSSWSCCCSCWSAGARACDYCYPPSGGGNDETTRRTPRRLGRSHQDSRVHRPKWTPAHIVPGDDSNKKAITVKTDCSFKCYGFFWLWKHVFWNTFPQPIWRYGNPDCQILGTLKNKIQIHGFLSFLSNNMGSDFIFRGAMYL